MNLFENVVPNIHYDICGILVLVIIIFSLFFRRMTKGELNHAFFLCVLSTLLTSIIDIISVFFYEPIDNTSYHHLFYLIHSSYYITRNLNLPAYICYIISNIGLWPVLRKKFPVFKAALILPYVGVIFLVILNIFTPVLFHYDEQLGFVRNQGRIYLYIESAFYMAYGVYIIIKYRKVFNKSQAYSLISIFPLTMIALFIQNIDANMLVEMFATTLVILLASITVHRPELLAHNELAAMTKYAYMQELKRLQYIKKPVTILLINISNYKDLKTYVPYKVLTKLLQELLLEGDNIKKQLKYKGSFYYLEDGLFAVISNKTPKIKTKEFAQEIYNTINTTAIAGEFEVHFTPKVCFFDCPDDISDFDTILSFNTNMETLLPADKAAIDVAELSASKNFLVRTAVDSIIANAIKNKLFRMYYQPIWSIEEQKFVSAEALIRLNDPKYGFVSPELFIAAAERNGSIYQIGDFIIDDVCRFIASEGFKKTGIKYVELNLSVAQCLQSDLVDKIKKSVEKHKIDYSQLNLEITERETIVDQSTFDANMQALCELGTSLSLDDYGTGYSNIRRISAMPLEIVKIDKSFVDLISNKDIHSILENTVKMLKDINKEIVVEGVEDKETLQEFEKMKCDFIQGYYFSKPLPEEDFVKFCVESQK